MVQTDPPENVRQLFTLADGVVDSLTEYFDADKKLDKVFAGLLPVDNA